MEFLAEVKDETQPFHGVNHERRTARAVVLNQNNEMALIHRKGKLEDFEIDSFLTPGGGIEANENPKQALMRELMEELGCECELIDEIGIIHDYFNKIKRKTISYYYLVRVKKLKNPMYTEKEQLLFSDTHWVLFDKALEMLQNHQPDVRGVTLHKREMLAIKKAKKILDGRK